MAGKLVHKWKLMEADKKAAHDLARQQEGRSDPLGLMLSQYAGMVDASNFLQSAS